MRPQGSGRVRRRTERRLLPVTFVGTSLSLVLNRSGVFHHQQSRNEYDQSADRKHDLSGQRKHKCMEPVLVQNVEQRDVCNHHADHHPVFLPNLGEHRFQIVVYDTNVRQFSDYRKQRVFQRSVILTSDQRIAPFAVDVVVDLFFQVSDTLSFL